MDEMNTRISQVHVECALLVMLFAILTVRKMLNLHVNVLATHCHTRQHTLTDHTEPANANKIPSVTR